MAQRGGRIDMDAVAEETVERFGDGAAKRIGHRPRSVGRKNAQGGDMRSGMRHGPSPIHY